MNDVIDKSSRATAAAKTKSGQGKVRIVRVLSKQGLGKQALGSTAGEYYTMVFSASPEDRIGMIRKGVSTGDVKKIIKDLGVEQKVFYDAIGLKTATVNRKAKLNAPLSSDESERLLGVAKLVGQLEMMVSESGDPEGFDAPEWMSNWLREPLPALGGAKPISFLDTMEGQALVSDALARIQSGAYS